jgi:predicted nucleotidyltransferase
MHRRLSNLPDSFTISQPQPSVPPGHPPLECYLRWLLRDHGEDIEFVALFGSRALGDALEDSDYDLLIGLRQEDGLRLTDRIGIYQDLETGKVQVLPYCPSELRIMTEDSNGLLLEALADGFSLFDRGTWKRMQTDHRTRVDLGELRRLGGVWEVFA